MTITSATLLNTSQLQDLDKLLVLCRQVDRGVPNVYTHILSKPRALPASLLYYENDELIGFLSAFFFYSDTVEIALLVNPVNRRRGIAAELIKTIVPLLKVQKIKQAIFCSPTGLHKDWLPIKEFSYLHSEYFMVRDEASALSMSDFPLDVQLAEEQDLDVLIALDSVCFPNKPGDGASRFDHLFDDPQYQAYIAYYQGKPIGKAHLRWDMDGVVLSDIAITPELQGKGLGTALITYCINLAQILGHKRVSLDVETHNERALHLYERLGFKVHNACDYWSIAVDKL